MTIEEAVMDDLEVMFKIKSKIKRESIWRYVKLLLNGYTAGGKQVMIMELEKEMYSKDDLSIADINTDFMNGINKGLAISKKIINGEGGEINEKKEPND